MNWVIFVSLCEFVWGDNVGVADGLDVEIESLASLPSESDYETAHIKQTVSCKSSTSSWLDSASASASAGGWSGALPARHS